MFGQFHPAGRRDTPVHQDVHPVGADVLEQALVVGDQHDAEGGPVGAYLVDARGDDAKGVDVEAGVGLVEDAERGLQQRHLQHLVALLLTAGETDIDATAEHVLRNVE